MRLIIGRQNLRDEYKEMERSKIRFEHCNDRAQKAIKIANFAEFWEYDNSNTIKVYYPKWEGAPKYDK